jgi:hypothetical protein
MTRIGDPLLAPVEAGLFGNFSLKTLSSKVLFPLRIRRGLSFAPFATFGIETGSEPYSASYGFGGELRLFGDVRSSSLNPYIGWQQYWLTEADGAGSGSSVYFGSRLYINDLAAIDGNFGPVFWKEDTPADEALPEWIARIGITVAFGRIKEKHYLNGKVLTVNKSWGKSEIRDSNFNPLKPGDIEDYDGEIRVYGLEERQPDSVEPCICAERTGNVSDLKFFNIDLDFGLVLDPLNRKAGLLDSAKSSEGEVFIAVLFNKKHTVVRSLNEKNTFFHFVDLDDCQYFGYRWDANRTRQPEYRDTTLGMRDSIHNQPYLGAFDEFVKPVTWLDGEELMGFIKGKDVEKELLRLLNSQHDRDSNFIANSPTPEPVYKMDQLSYRIGYVKYKQSTISKIKSHLYNSNLGVAVMIGVDQDSDGLFITDAEAPWEKEIGSPDNIDPTTIVAFDKNDDFYFSNLVKIEDLYIDDVIIDGFGLCSTELTGNHIRKIADSVFARLDSDQDLTIELYGYADGTPMTEKCRELYPDPDTAKAQEQLAYERAEAVKTYLTSIKNIRSERIKVIGKGIKLPGRKYKAEDRCVIVRFSK